MRDRIALLLLTGLMVLPAIAATDSDAGATQRVQVFLRELTGLRAEFRQSVTDARGRVIENSEGTVSLARPGRFRWDYRVPEQLIVSDGVTVWLYDIELEQVTVRAADQALAGTPAMLLAGQGDFGDEFLVTDAGDDGGLAWCQLTPRRPDGDFRELRLGFDGRELRRMTLFDRLGQTTELQFMQVERNPRFEDSLFKFKPPPGVDVVGRPPPG